MGALITGLASPGAGDELAEPSEKTGVIAVKFVKTGLLADSK
jgi:hypothetical protein